MIQNLKVDIIYYKTNTDFEMEFNLCGCCRMRLLNDRVSDPKTLVNSLARAVSRSKVTIITGPLFGDDGLTKLVAGALSTGTEIADNKTFGIEGDTEISILKGATPLVTADGIFGGCIIESGPQTMILLSDNKNVRKSIMQNLIHPYIDELASGVTTTKTTSEPEEQITEDTVEDVAEETLETIEETEEIQKETESDEEDFEIDLDEFKEDEDEEFDLELNEDLEEIDEEEENITLGALLSSVDDEEEYSEEYLRAKEMSENGQDNAEEFIGYMGFDKVKEPINIPILIFSILLLLAIAVLCYCLFFFPASSGTPAISYIREIYHAIFG